MKVLCRLSESLNILNKTHFKEQLKKHIPSHLLKEIIFDESMLTYDSYGRTSCFHVVVGDRRFVVLQPGSLMLASATLKRTALSLEKDIAKAKRKLKEVRMGEKIRKNEKSDS